eukprot:COSAG04_NODE_1371_length_7040_cov_8.745714_6_plen_399_part_00
MDPELGDWLHETGRAVARAADGELPSADDAAAMIGAGLADELKKRARAVGRDLGGHAKAIGSAALGAAKAEAAESARANIKTAGDAKTHAGRVGSAAVGAAKAAARQAAKDLIAKHFGPLGGDGIQRPCALKVTDLRRAITRARRNNFVTGPAKKAQLLAVVLKHVDGFEGDRRTATAKKLLRQRGAKIDVVTLRDLRTALRVHFHPPASRMARDDVIQYVFWTAQRLGWKWTELDSLTQRKRVSDACMDSAHPAFGQAIEPAALQTTQPRKARAKSNRPLSKYQKHIRDYMAANKDVPAKERFAAAIEAWNAGAKRRDAAKQGAQNRKEAKERIADRLATRKERLEQERAERLAKDAERSREPYAKLKKAQAKFGGRIPKKAPKARRNYIPPDSDEE